MAAEESAGRGRRCRRRSRRCSRRGSTSSSRPSGRCSSAARSRARSSTAARSRRSRRTSRRSTAALVALVRKELVRPEQPLLAGDDAFRFRHLLIRDAAYDALPKAERAELHERFAALARGARRRPRRAGRDRRLPPRAGLPLPGRARASRRGDARRLATQASGRLIQSAERARDHGDLVAEARPCSAGPPSSCPRPPRSAAKRSRPGPTSSPRSVTSRRPWRFVKRLGPPRARPGTRLSSPGSGSASRTGDAVRPGQDDPGRPGRGAGRKRPTWRGSGTSTGRSGRCGWLAASTPGSGTAWRPTVSGPAPSSAPSESARG